MPARYFDQHRQGFLQDKSGYICLILYSLLFVGFFFLNTDQHRNVFYASVPFSLAVLYQGREAMAQMLRESWKSWLLILVFLAYIALSLLWSETTEEGRFFDKGKILLFLPLSLLTLALLVQRFPFALQWLTTAFVASAAVTGLYLLVTHFDSAFYFRLKGLGRADNSVMGAYLYALAFLAVLYAKPFTQSPRPYRLILLGIIGIVILFTMSRGPLLALGATIAAMAVFHKYYKFVALLCVAGLLGLIFVFASGLRQEIPIVKRADSGRPQVWAQAIEQAKEKPFFGHGVGSKFYYDIHNKNGKFIETASHPHNLYVGTFLQGGLVGLVLMMGIVVATTRRICGLAKDRKESWPLAAYISCLIMGLYDFGGVFTGLNIGWLAFWYPFALSFSSAPKAPLRGSL